MNNTINLVAVTFDKTFLEHSWVWLQDEEIRDLTMTPNFSKEQQINWFNSLKQRYDYLIWGIQFQGNPVGAFGIKNIRSNSGEYWGYIGNKSYWGKGIGKWMINTSIEYASKNDIECLYLRTNYQNTRAINLYLKTGFIISSIEDSVLWMKRYV
ncbi:GNAT family N-acetyltransferase [Nostoc sphaeroides]|uniref:N-acetyltransferase n=1 Tax=Nostoc sphaeroides CCNUC1 TaxID=2653204 RepID=A0A5P8VYG2_9NOSO|nr:GNAT family N-acetyltransferase [Nostoc sphaeroides]QFS45351.1 N-acetyltransferase [Nostoc sphaeroides CCNUC1]